MKAVYQTNDGAVFESFETASQHEFEVEHPHMRDCKFYDINGKELSTEGDDIYDDTLYCRTMRIDIPSEEALADLIELAKYNSWGCIEDSIDSVGKWFYQYSSGANKGYYRKAEQAPHEQKRKDTYSLDSAITAFTNILRDPDYTTGRELTHQTIDWLKELKEYRALGTIYKVKSLLNEKIEDDAEVGMGNMA